MSEPSTDASLRHAGERVGPAQDLDTRLVADYPVAAVFYDCDNVHVRLRSYSRSYDLHKAVRLTTHKALGLSL